MNPEPTCTCTHFDGWGTDAEGRQVAMGGVDRRGCPVHDPRGDWKPEDEPPTAGADWERAEAEGLMLSEQLDAQLEGQESED